jgi:hypothetical protein
MPLSKTFQLYRGGQFQTINTCKFNSIYRKDTYLQWYEFEMHEYGMEQPCLKSGLLYTVFWCISVKAIVL